MLACINRCRRGGQGDLHLENSEEGADVKESDAIKRNIMDLNFKTNVAGHLAHGPE